MSIVKNNMENNWRSFRRVVKMIMTFIVLLAGRNEKSTKLNKRKSSMVRLQFLEFMEKEIMVQKQTRPLMILAK